VRPGASRAAGARVPRALSAAPAGRIAGGRAPATRHTPSCNRGGAASAPSRRLAVRALVEATPPLPYLEPVPADGPSSDLADVAVATLELLPLLLAGAAAGDVAAAGAAAAPFLPPPPALRAAVYARTAASIASGKLTLARVAGTAPADGSADPGALLSLDAADAAAEDWLVRQDVVPLPDGGGLVLPLAAGRFLVGLLVVELDFPPGSPPAPPSHAAALRRAAAVLAAAAALDARAALDAADAAARRARAAALVESARGPLAVLRTFGAMLSPRLTGGGGGGGSGAVEADLADGIRAQGDALAALVAALATALHPPPAPLRRAAVVGAVARPSAPAALPGAAVAAPGRALPPPPPRARPALADPERECVPEDVVVAVLADAAPRAEALGVALEFERPGGASGPSPATPPPLLRKPARPLPCGVPAATLAAALGDAVDSALQRCARGGCVSVALALADGGAVHVDVTDDGVGEREGLAARLRGAKPPPTAPAVDVTAAAVMERLAAGLPAGSGAAALAAATRAANGVGGRVTVLPAAGGGTRVRIWLPPPASKPRAGS